jgi:hypothetical protein
MPGADFDLARSYGDDDCDWKPWKEQVLVS